MLNLTTMPHWRRYWQLASLSSHLRGLPIFTQRSIQAGQNAFMECVLSSKLWDILFLRNTPMMHSLTLSEFVIGSHWRYASIESISGVFTAFYGHFQTCYTVHLKKFALNKHNISVRYLIFWFTKIKSNLKSFEVKHVKAVYTHFCQLLKAMIFTQIFLHFKINNILLIHSFSVPAVSVVPEPINF